MKSKYRYILAAVVWSVFMVGQPVSAAATNSLDSAQWQAYRDRLQFADGLYTREMYEQSAREYAALVIKYPDGPANDAAVFRLAESLRLQGRSGEAARLYSQLVARYKESPFRLRAAYRRARIYMDDKDYSSAIDHFNAVLQEKPPPALAGAATFYLGRALLKSGDDVKADQAFADLLKQYPGSDFRSRALMYRGEIYRDRWLKALKAAGGKPDTDIKDAERALEFFGRALKEEGDERMAAEDLYQMAEIYFRRHDYEKSTELYHRLMIRYPEDVRAVTARLQAAWSANNSRMYADALHLAQQALADPELKEARDEWLYLKANAERQLMQNRDAVKSYLQLLVKYPESRFAVPARYETAVTYFKMGRYEDAIRHAEMIRITPEIRSDVCWLLAESYAALNRGAEAVQYYRMVVKTDPASERARDAMFRLAHQLQKQQAWNEAATAYNELANRFPKSDLAPKALYGAAFALENMQDYEAAVRDWRRLANGYPQSELAQHALYQKAMCEIRLKRNKDAGATFDELLRRFPDSRFAGDAYYWKGVLLYEQSKYQQAEENLRLALQKSSRDELKGEAAFRLGLTLQKLKKNDEAAAVFSDLLNSPVSAGFSPALLEWLANYYIGRKEYAAAAKAAELLSKSSEKAWRQAGFVLLGQSLDGRGMTAEAAAAYRQALAIAVVTRYAAEAALRLGDIALEEKRSADAATFFNTALARTVDANRLEVQLRASFGLGRAAELGGDKADAARSFMKVAILYDDPQVVPEALYRAAAAYAGLGKTVDCKKSAEELLQRYPQSEWARKVDKQWLK